VVVPLMAAPVCVLIGGAERAWRLATAVSWVAFLIATVLLSQVIDGGFISYELGGWAAPWGIEYRVDALDAFVLVLVSGTSALTLLFARDSVTRDVAENRRDLFYTAWMLCLTGLLGITITGDAFNVFVFLEISSLSSYTLIALSQQPRALLASFRYLIMGTVGATFILIGIGLLYMMTGTLNMADLAARLPAVMHTHSVRAAFGLLTVGLALKIAIFPMHHWLPEAYTRAPAAVTVFFSATSTKVALYVLIRFFYDVFGPEYTFEVLELGRLLLPLALLGIVVATLVAIYQDDVRRLFAWSSVAQLGYMTLALSTATGAGLTAGLVHLFNHALMKAAIFLAIGCVAYRIGPVTIGSMAGLGRRMPWTIGGLVIGCLSLVGVPMTAGFISKWYLLVAVLERGWWPVAGLVVLTSLLAAVYVWRVLGSAYFGEPNPDTIQAKAHEAPWLMLVPLWVLALANLWFGVETSLSVGVPALVAETLFGGTP
ncbi:MAG: monovalent cation/H+ antiporter subunit D family protein, partial [Planctomycetes bacterium]|nr:monovalent cation/H+ antiporter subunit D family protein [Planctomycetota bacterium]